MILRGERYCVNVSVWNLTSDTSEYETTQEFVRSKMALDTSSAKVAMYLRHLANKMERVELDGEEDE